MMAMPLKNHRSRVIRSAVLTAPFFALAIRRDSKNATPRADAGQWPRCYTRGTVILMARPAAPLEPFVRGYIQLEIAVSGRPIVAPIPARSAPILEFTLGD